MDVTSNILKLHKRGNHNQEGLFTFRLYHSMDCTKNGCEISKSTLFTFFMEGSLPRSWKINFYEYNCQLYQGSLNIRFHTSILLASAQYTALIIVRKWYKTTTSIIGKWLLFVWRFDDKISVGIDCLSEKYGNSCDWCLEAMFFCTNPGRPPKIDRGLLFTNFSLVLSARIQPKF